ARPEIFTGDKQKFGRWWRSMQLFLRDPKNGTLLETEKTDILISHIRGPDVDTWWQKSWVDVVTILKERFEDSNLQRQAELELEHLVQGKDSAEEFFQKFEILRNRAKYDKKNTHLLLLLEQNVNAGIIDKIYRVTPLPADYDAWKKAILVHDALWKRRLENKRLQGQTSSWKKSTDAPMTSMTKQQAPTAGQTRGDRKDATGKTYGGMGQPMDLNRACLKCGAK
ncbi:hypothetical protein JAAARDRAFT_92951, partial [Jaapia argillacea MUCL 33604]